MYTTTHAQIEDKKSLLYNIHEQGQIIIHCHCNPHDEDLFIRIWKSTYLFANDSDHVSNLVHAENITLFPAWLLIPRHTPHTFTLIFSGLPRTCHSFDMIEDIPENGGFQFQRIVRSHDDIYEVFI